jgi:hypothetical protein
VDTRSGEGRIGKGDQGLRSIGFNGDTHNLRRLRARLRSNKYMHTYTHAYIHIHNVCTTTDLELLLRLEHGVEQRAVLLLPGLLLHRDAVADV